MALIMVIAVPAFAQNSADSIRKCRDPAYLPGTPVTIDSGRSLCDEARSMCVDCEILRLTLINAKEISKDFNPLVPARGLPYTVPTDAQLRKVCDSFPNLCLSAKPPLEKAAVKVLKGASGKPVPYASEVERRVRGPMLWKYPGGDKLKCSVMSAWTVMRPFYEAWHNALSVMEEKYKSRDLLPGKFAFHVGDTLEEMVGGACHLYGKNRKVVGAWNNPNAALYGDLYEIDFTDSILQVICFDTCGNWGWKTRYILPEIPPPTKIRAPSYDTVWSGPTSEKFDSSWGEVTDTITKSGWDTLPVMEVPDLGRKALPRGCLFAGDDRPYPNMFGRQGGQFYGAKLDVLYPKINKPNPVLWGFTGMIDGWDGEVRTGFRYAGFEGSAGPLLVWCLSPYCYWGFDLCFGGQWNWNYGSPNYRYDALQTNLFGGHDETFDAFGKGWHLSLWGGVKLAFDAQKTSHRNGVKLYQSGNPPDSLYDPISDASGADGGGRIYFGTGVWPVEPLLVYRGGYAVFDGSISNAAGIGLAFLKESLILEVSAKDRERSRYGKDNDGWSLETVLTWAIGSGRGKAGSFK